MKQLNARNYAIKALLMGFLMASASTCSAQSRACHGGRKERSRQSELESDVHASVTVVVDKASKEPVKSPILMQNARPEQPVPEKDSIAKKAAIAAGLLAAAAGGAIAKGLMANEPARPQGQSISVQTDPVRQSISVQTEPERISVGVQTEAPSEQNDIKERKEEKESKELEEDRNNDYRIDDLQNQIADLLAEITRLRAEGQTDDRMVNQLLDQHALLLEHLERLMAVRNPQDLQYLALNDQRIQNLRRLPDFVRNIRIGDGGLP